MVNKWKVKEIENSVSTCADLRSVFTYIFINMFTNDSLFFISCYCTKIWLTT